MLRRTSTFGAILLSLVLTSRESPVTAGEKKPVRTERSLIDPSSVRL